VSNQVVYGTGERGVTFTWGIKGGGKYKNGMGIKKE
jgi:hypothetical protein